MIPPIVFDIGKVLIRYEPGPALEALTRRVGRSRWRVRWALGRAGIGRLGRGEIEPKAFLVAVNRQLGADLSHDELRDIWGLDIPGPVDGMLDLLDAVTHSGAVVALLSDTNAFHWEFMQLRFPALAAVPNLFLSFREGLSKPDPQFYRLAESRLRKGESTTAGKAEAGGNKAASTNHDLTDPTKKGKTSAAPPILYFDDLPPNVKAAQSNGWDAHRFLDRPTTEGILHQRGVLH